MNLTEFNLQNDKICLKCFEILKPYMQKHIYKKQHILWKEQDKGNMALFLDEGFCKVYKTLPDGKEISLFLFGKNKFFGFLPLLDNSFYPASVKALTDISVYTINKKNFIEIIETNSQIAFFIIKSLTSTLKSSLLATERFAIKKPFYKVASALYLLNFETNSIYNIITLPVSSKEYAEMLGITPETFSRVITKFQQDNIIKKLEKNVFQIINLKYLKELSSFF